MADFQIPDKTLLTSVDRAADSLLIYDADAFALKRSTVNNLLDLTSHPVGINDTQTLAAKTLTSPTISSPVLSGTITGTYTIGGTPTFPSTVVTTTGTQTLTNKTLTSPTITTATIANPTLTIDTISEFTAANGVTIDGLSIKDGKLNTANSVVATNITDAIITNAKLSTATGELGGPFATWTPAPTGFSSSTVNIARYNITGKIVTMVVDISGTSNTTGFTFTLPAAAKSVVDYPVRVQNNGSIGTAIGLLETAASSTTATVYVDLAGTGWTAANTKRIFGTVITYEAA